MYNLDEEKSNEVSKLPQRVQLKPANFFTTSLLADTIKSVNAFGQCFAQMAESQKKFAEDMQRAAAPMKQIAETLRNVSLPAKIAQGLPDFSKMVARQNTIAETVQSGFKMAEWIKPLDISGITNSFPNISQVISPLRAPTKLFTDIGVKAIEALSAFTGSFRTLIDGIRNVFEPFIRLIKSNYFIIVYASEGDRMALHRLGRLWWRLGKRYLEIERLKGREPNKQEFESLVQEVCWEVLKTNEEKGVSWLEIARIVYYSLVAKLFANWIEVLQTERFNEAVEVEILSNTHKSKAQFYYDENGNPNLFTKTVARHLGVSPQTIRNWVKSGQVKAVKISYFSRIKHALVPAYLLPFEAQLFDELSRIKGKRKENQRHQLNGYFTVTQVAKMYGISRKTLERWDIAGKLVPRRIKGIRYYTKSQTREVPAILLNNQSPKIKGLLATHRLSY